MTALSVLFFQGGPNLGQLQSGAIAALIGPMPAAAIGGCGVVLVAAFFSRLPAMRRYAWSRSPYEA